jgi:hypothetical protein
LKNANKKRTVAGTAIATATDIKKISQGIHR